MKRKRGTRKKSRVKHVSKNHSIKKRFKKKRQKHKTVKKYVNRRNARKSTYRRKKNKLTKKKIHWVQQESSKKYLHDLKKSKKPSNLSENKELEFMLKSIKFNNPGVSYKILEAFKMIDRKIFVKHNFYEDMPVPIAHGQTISQPTTIARMLRLLNLEPGQNILEIGSNTGYHASLVSWLVSPGNVTTIEIFPDLAHNARINLKNLLHEFELKKIKKTIHVQIFTGDALNKYQEIWQKRYDRIYFTGSLSIEKLGLMKHLAQKALKDEGLLLFPSSSTSSNYGGLELWKKKNNKLILLKIEPGYAFVPIVRQKDIEDLYKKLR